jgi:hypothetical protein
MPRLEFWFTTTDAIAWSFDREPELGEDVVLGDRGVYRVMGIRAEPADPDVTEFICELVRESTREDRVSQLKRGVHVLPPR